VGAFAIENRVGINPNAFKA